MLRQVQNAIWLALPALPGLLLGCSSRERVGGNHLGPSPGAWAVEGYDLERTGAFPETAANGLPTAGSPEVRWRAHLGGYVGLAPSVFGEHVFASSSRGEVWALDWSSGVPSWRSEVGFPLGQGSPTMVSGLVVCHGSGGVAALRADTGELAWHFRTDLPVPRTPAVLGTAVYFGCLDGTVYSLDGSTGTPQWQTRPADRSSGESVPIHRGAVVANGLVYVPSMSGHLLALDAAGGDIRLAPRPGYIVGASCSVQGDTLLAQTMEQLVCLDSLTGRARWSCVVDDCDPPTPAPLICSGTAYVVQGNSQITAVGLLDGRQQWRARLRGRVTGMFIDQGILYASCETGWLHALHSRDGAEVWAFRTGLTHKGAPVVLHGMAFAAGSSSGDIIALHLPRPSSSAEPSPAAPPSTAGRRYHTPLTSPGAERR